MTDQTDPAEMSKNPCLEDLDFCDYITCSPGTRSLAEIELHLLSCSLCLKELAGLIKILHPEPLEESETAQDSSPREVASTLALIRQVSRRDREGRARPYRWYRWAAIAAAVLIVIGLSSVGLFHLYEKNRSEAFYLQARSLLQEVYAPQSPSDLRLDLPFRSEAIQRERPGEETLSRAEHLLYQALALREGMREANLGLGYLHLRENQFAKAEGDFQRVLNAGNADLQALLGRGVSRLEEGMRSSDPVDRDARLKNALEDFNTVLQSKPESNEALFNKARALYEMGRHQQALKEIDAYLSRDPGSIWALKLKELQTRIRMNRADAVEREVRRAAEARDSQALETLVRVARFQIPGAIRSALLDSVDLEDQPAQEGVPDSSDLKWAARVLASAHEAATGDKSYSRLLQFYGGLSPPQRRAKRKLDVLLEQFIDLYNRNQIKPAFLASESLIRQFEASKDYWQLVRLYQLRGNSYYYSKPDFIAVSAEYLKMLECAERSEDPDLIARALSALASAYNAQQGYDEALATLSKLKALSESHHMEQWGASAANSLGSAYLKLNRLEESMREYTSALALAYRLMDQQALVVTPEYLGDVMGRMGRCEDARRFYLQATEWLDAFAKDTAQQSVPEVKVRRINLLRKQGHLALRVKDLATAETRFKEALAESSQNMRELETQSRIALAQVYLETKRFKEAEAEVHATLEIVATNQFPEIAWQAHSLAGVLRRQDGDNARALMNFDRAVQVLEQMRTHISSEDLRQSFLTRRFDPFREAVSLLYYSQENPQRALDYVGRAKCMTLREYLQPGARASNSDGRNPSWVRSPGLSESLPPGTVILEYFLSSDQIFIFLSEAGGVESASSSIPLSDLEDQIQRYLKSIRGNDAPAFDELSRTLHRRLIDPVLNKLESRSVDTLVVLPDGPLYLLPFGSLKDSSGHYLLEKFALSYAPSRSILHYCLAMNKAAGFTPESSTLLLDGASNLPGAARELADLARIYAKRNRLAGSADLTSLAPTIGSYEIVHFSGHAITFRGKPRLVFSGLQGETYLDASTIESWKLEKNRLVSLAGCNTGIGPLSEGEAPWGLLPAFLNAGAPAILVSLLSVDDVAAGKLTLRFYDLLSRGVSSRSNALRQAQLSLLRSVGAEQDRRPLAWAPFVLLGDPR